MNYTEAIQVTPSPAAEEKAARPKAKNTLFLKIALDAVMLLLLLTCYKKHAVSMAFHEMAGLAIFGLFLIHNLLNRRWIQGVTRKLLKKSTNVNLKVSWLVDLLLLLSMSCIIVTGLMITKTLPFQLPQLSGAKQLHYFCAALSVILMGIHLGLHWPLFRGMASKVTWLRSKAARVAGILLLVICFGFGIYNLGTGSFPGWISGPFTASAFPQGEFKGGDMEGMGERPDFDRQEGEMRQHSSEGGPEEQSISIANILGVIAQYGSEMTVFAVPTALLFGRKRKLHKPVQAENAISA